jgi:hypothetical protein
MGVPEEALWVSRSSTAAIPIAATTASEASAARERRRIAHLRRGTHRGSEATA